MYRTAAWNRRTPCGARKECIRRLVRTHHVEQHLARLRQPPSRIGHQRHRVGEHLRAFGCGVAHRQRRTEQGTRDVHTEHVEELLPASEGRDVGPLREIGMLCEVGAHRRYLIGGWQLALVSDEPLYEVARIVDAGNAHEIFDDVVRYGIATPPHPVEVLVCERRWAHGLSNTSAASAGASSSDVSGSTV
jgi:hypothetical protein